MHKRKPVQHLKLNDEFNSLDVLCIRHLYLNSGLWSAHSNSIFKFLTRLLDKFINHLFLNIE